MDSPYVFAQRAKYGPDYCRQVAWAVIDDAHQYFEQRVSPNAFITGDSIAFPVSRLSEMAQDLYYGRNIHHMSYPDKWTHQNKRWGGGGGGTNGRGQPYQQPPRRPPQFQAPRDGTYMAQQQQQRPQDPRNVDHCHHKVKAMMREYNEKFNGRIGTGKICQAANVDMKDLPVMTNFKDSNGHNNICLAHVLGHCPRPSCPFNHVDGRGLHNGWVEELCTTLCPGV